jgi:hypothetical protein
VQLIRRGLSDLAIFKELPVPLTVFSVDSADESEMKLNNTRVQHHHLFGLFNAPAQIDLNRYIVDDYIISDPSTPKSSETSNTERDFLTYLLNRSESDESLRCKFFWLLRSSAISSCVKYRSNHDFRTGKRLVTDGSYYLIEALITFVGRLILMRTEDVTSQCRTDSTSSPSGAQQKETVSNELESLTVLFEPLAAVISSHDDLAALWAILLNNATASGGSSSQAICNTLHHPDEQLPGDAEEALTKCLKATSTGGYSMLGMSKEGNVGEGVDEDTAGAEDPWRDVTPPCSLLKASTVLLLCGGLPENDQDPYHICSNQLLLSRLDFARPFLSARQRAALDDALTRPPLKGRHKGLFLDSESRDAVEPPLCTTSLSADLAAFTSQCRLINSVWLATEGLRSGFSLPESCERRNERFRESLRSSIGQGFFLPSSGRAELKISDPDPGSLSPSSMVSGRCWKSDLHAAAEMSSRRQVNNLEKDKETEKEDKDNEMEKDKVLALKVDPPPLEPRADQSDRQAGTGVTLRHPFWPLPSPLHPTSVLLTGLDISKVIYRPAVTTLHSLLSTHCHESNLY